jgi:uncharacterized protein YndB with AHSA1/START domain
MPICICDARPGGKIRYEWADGKGGGFSLTGEFIELVPFSRIVHVERMHLPDPTPDNHVETRFEAEGTGTLLTMRMTLPDAETRAAMLATGMEHGMEASYVRLETQIAGEWEQMRGAAAYSSGQVHCCARGFAQCRAVCTREDRRRTSKP